VTSVAASGTTPNRGAPVYLAAQAAVVLVWWVAVLALPTVRGWFFPYGGLDPAFVAFVVPDLAFIVAGSLVVARRRLRGEAAPLARGVLLGAVGYATLYTLGWTFLLHAPAGGLVAMGVMGVGTWRACRA
jgi:hypothetical protein